MSETSGDLNRDDAAAQLGVSTRTLERYVRDGRITPYTRRVIVDLPPSQRETEITVFRAEDVARLNSERGRSTPPEV